MAENTGQISTKKIVAIFAGGLATAILLVVFAFPSSGIGQLFKGSVNPPSLDISGSGCTNDQLKESNTKICQTGFFVLCNAAREGDLTIDETFQCTSGKWIAYEEPPSLPDPTPDPDPDPTPDPDPDPDPDPTPPATLVDITDEEADPDSFSPLTRSTDIVFTVNKEAKVDVKIKDSEDKAVVTLEADSPLEGAGTYKSEWFGTEDNEADGTVVDPGTYKFVIVGKNKTTGAIEDTETGEVDVVYSTDDDPEDTSPRTSTPTPPPAPTPTPPPAPNQNDATMTTQNRDTGRTSDTGPAMFIYLLAPVGGYLITRKYRK